MGPLRAYDRGYPLFSLHVPKCGGQSMRRVLENWYKEAFRIHYFQQFNSLPPRHELLAGTCIHGHFNHALGFGVKAYYPDACQFITVLRDPLEMAISNYFFWKRKERARKLALGMLIPGDTHDYTSIDDFLKKRPLTRIMDFLPEDMNSENYREYLRTHFIWVGVADTLDSGIHTLSRRLGFPAAHLEHINSSPRDEILSPAIEREYRDRNRWAFELVDFARRLERDDCCLDKEKL